MQKSSKSQLRLVVCLHTFECSFSAWKVYGLGQRQGYKEVTAHQGMVFPSQFSCSSSRTVFW